MAPPTGPRAGNSNRPSHNHNKPGTRGTRGGGGGGGISKRRGAPRTDRDGDVSMGTTAASSANPPTGPASHSTRPSRGSRGGRGARGNRAGQLAQNVRNYVSEHDGTARHGKARLNKVTLKIHGLKDSKASGSKDGGLRSLLEFLERKASKDRSIILGRGSIHGDHVWLKVNPDDAPDLLRLNGYTYAGAVLTIEETRDPIPGSLPAAHDSADKPSEIKDKLTAVLGSRYNAQQKLLDLSALAADPTLLAMGAFESKPLAEKSFKALMRITATTYDNPAKIADAIQAVSLANNDILDVSEVFTLGPTLPRLRRLDLGNNKLQDFSKLSKWRHELRRLEELHLVGNPLTNQPNYPNQVIEAFPYLQILDGRRIRTQEEATASLAAWFPTPLPCLPSNLRDGENNVASTFLRGFFTLYDHNRTDLARQFYDDESLFSVNVASSVAASAYTSFSRNLQTMGTRGPALQQRLFSGGNVIAELWNRLPATQHPSMDQAIEWQIDCHTFPNLADPTGQGAAMGLAIDVSSRFEELDPAKPTSGIRSFFRSFILGPSKPGAPHPFRVVSDKLTVRDWTPQETNVAAPPPAVQAAVPVAPAPAASSPAILTEEQQAWMIQEVARRTGMNAEYSRLCLTGAANWNLELALQVFEEKKADLPPEAFSAR